MQDKESERRALQTKEKSVTHWVQGGQEKKVGKRKSAKKKKKAGGQREENNPAFSLGEGGVRGKAAVRKEERERERRHMEKKRENRRRGECQG